MDLIQKYTYDLNIEIIENYERIRFVSRDCEYRYIDNNINKNDTNCFGYFFINLVNKKNDIISFFDKLSLTISKSKVSIYDNWNHILMSFLKDNSYNNSIESDFIPFYLRIIDGRIREHLGDLRYNQNEIEKINNSTSEYDMSGIIGILNTMAEKNSPEQCKIDIVSSIENDKKKYIESIDSLEFYLNLDRKTYTKKQMEYINRETIIPRCRKLLCFEINNTYYRYLNLPKKINHTDIRNPIPLNIYEINSINELLDLYVGFFIDKEIDLRKCENCGKYFISENGTKYCNNLFENTNKTCVEIGAKIKYSNKSIPKKYNTIVNRYRRKINYYSDKNIKAKKTYSQELANFKKEYNDLKKSKVSESDLEKWLDMKISEYNKNYNTNNEK